MTTQATGVDFDLWEFLPRRLYTRHICAAFDEPPSRVRYWLDSGQLANRALKLSQYRWVTPEDLVIFAAAQGLTPNWDAVEEVDMND